MLRAFVLSLVACVFAAAGVGAAAAQPRARLELDSRCDALAGLVPATVAVVTGDMSDARKSARTLRDLAGRELVPRKVKPALRRLARFFTEARHQSIVERATALGGLSSSIAVVVEYGARICSELPDRDDDVASAAMRPADWDAIDPRTPVIAGVGVASQHLDEPGAGLEALELMIAATRAAGDDCGAPAILREVQRVAVPGGSWKYTDPGRVIAERIGAPGVPTVLVPPGTPQQTLINDAYASIIDGTLDVALVVGGEAARRAAMAWRAGVTVVDTDQGGAQPGELRLPTGDIVTKIEIAGGFGSAAAPFAMIDNALRAAEGRSLDEHRDDIARLWAGFNAVAAHFPDAAFPEPRDAAFLREPSEANRPMAFPYNKWHVAQMNVDQAAAILICSLDAAARLGVAFDQVVFPLVALESSYSVPISERRAIHRWTGMEVLGQAATAHLGGPLTEIAHAELYSCFPAAVRVQQRALGLPVDGVPTITGGEPFAGGPWNNFVLQATAAMIERVRAEPENLGLVSTVSGLLNKPGLAVYATRPGPDPLLLADLADENERAAERVEAIPDHHGPARVATYTVSYEGQEPVRCVIIADTPDGTRCVAGCDDADLARQATREELIGQTVHVEGNRFTG